jgi:hypothetical protein
MDRDFLRAFEAAKAKYLPEVWFGIDPSERAAAIYAELRRIDAETATQADRAGKREPSRRTA